MPTMPEDILPLVRGAVGGGQFYGNYNNYIDFFPRN